MTDDRHGDRSRHTSTLEGTNGRPSHDIDENLLSDRELPWMKEKYNRNRLLIVKLTGRFLSRILSKMRSPQRHDEADSQLNKLLDQYIRLYLGEQARPGRGSYDLALASAGYARPYGGLIPFVSLLGNLLAKPGVAARARNCLRWRSWISRPEVTIVRL